MTRLLVRLGALTGALALAETPATTPSAEASPAAITRTVPDEPASAILDLRLEDSHTLRIPTHPGRTTTVVFPEPPGVPDGAGFTTDPTAVAGDFHVSWTPGDRHFSIVPLRPGRTRNLNVPCGSHLVVLLVEPAASPEAAALLVRLHPPGETPPPPSAPSVSPAAVRSSQPPINPYENATPARLLGLITRLKLVHACPPGAQRLALVRSLRAVSYAEPNLTTCGEGFRIEPVIALRDERLDLVGFALLVTNQTNAPLRLAPGSWAARAGAGFYRAATCDGATLLAAGETAPAYFVIQGNGRGGPGHLAAANPWEFSVALAKDDNGPGSAPAPGKPETSPSPQP